MDDRPAWLSNAGPSLALLFVLGAASLYHGETPPAMTIFLWFLLAMGIGLVAARRCALMLAVVPWLLSTGARLALEHQSSLPGGWEQSLLSSVLVGAVGIAVGIRGSET